MTQGPVLIIGPAWIGDMIMAQTLFTLLKQRQPDVMIDVMAPPATLPLVARMPEVRQALAFEVGHGQLNLAYRRTAANRLRSAGYAQAIVLPNSLKSALVPWLADIPVRTGFRGEFRYGLLNDIRLLDKRRLPRMIDRFVALGQPAGMPLPDITLPKLQVDLASRDQLQAALGLTMQKPVLGLCPGAEFGDAKRWPAAHYASLASMAAQRGMQVWLFGGPKDQAVAEELLAGIDRDQQTNVVNLVGKTQLLDAIDLLSLCQLVVSNDSGLMHIAAAVGCSTTVVYGSTSPDFTPPLTTRLNIVSQQLDCSPCFKRTCPLGHKNCLNQLLPQQLIPIVEQHLADLPRS